MGGITLSSTPGKGTIFAFDVQMNNTAAQVEIGYTYKDDTMASALPVSNFTSPRAETLAAMPAEWVAALHQSAIETDAELVGAPVRTNIYFK